MKDEELADKAIMAIMRVLGDHDELTIDTLVKQSKLPLEACISIINKLSEQKIVSIDGCICGRSDCEGGKIIVDRHVSTSPEQFIKRMTSDLYRHMGKEGHDVRKLKADGFIELGVSMGAYVLTVAALASPDVEGQAAIGHSMIRNLCDMLMIDYEDNHTMVKLAELVHKKLK